MGIRIRTKTILLAAAAGAAVIGVFLGGTIVYYEKMKIPKVETAIRNMTIEEIQSLQEEEKEKEVPVWILQERIAQGDPIDSTKLISITIPESLVPAGAVSTIKDIERNVARIDLEANTLLSQKMMVDVRDKITADLRVQDYSHIQIPLDIAPEQFVDIRLKRPDGSDEVVLSKKKILAVSGTTIWLAITEEERLYMNTSSVERALIDGSLYTTRYPDPENQPAAIVTYRPDEKILAMMEANPNIVQEAMELYRQVEEAEPNGEEEVQKEQPTPRQIHGSEEEGNWEAIQEGGTP